jgi:hypothetical protein
MRQRMFDQLLDRLSRRKAIIPTSLLGALAATLIATAPLALASSRGPVESPASQPQVQAVKVSTRVSIEVPTGSVIGKDVTVVATLRSGAGRLLPGQHLSLYLDGAQIRSDRTDAQGRVSFIVLGKKLNQARAYPLQVVFGGSRGWGPSRANATLTVLTAAVQVQTVPPLPGVRVTLGSVAAVTGPDGVAALPVPATGVYPLNADLNPNTGRDATVKASFVRWLDNVYSTSRTIDVTGPATYTMGLRIAYRASVQYVDLDNDPVDPALIEQAQFSAGTGADDVVLNSQTSVRDIWWTGNSVARVSNTLLPSPITYRALSVKIHGAEVVNRGQQFWTPSENGVWTIQLLLYPMTVTTRDAFFGMPVSGQLQLTYPDGATIDAHVDGSGQARFVDLPRGVYQLKLHPAAISPPTPVALSRPQDATLRVITFLDVSVAAGALIAAVVALFLIGRWSMIMARRRRAGRDTAPGDLAAA